MNIFYLNHNPKICAEMHNDKHCVKMILEYAQLLSTAHRVLDGIPQRLQRETTGRQYTAYRLSDDRDGVLYSATHINHPSAIWVRQSSANYVWLYNLWRQLMIEYTHRYGKNHACEKLIKHLCIVPQNISDAAFTEPTPAMPDEYKVPGDSIASYQNYYINSKSHLANWKNRKVPDWYHANV